MGENPPQDKKKEYLSLKEEKSKYDITPEELSLKKKEFFGYIDSIEENKGRDQLVRIVATVAEHSVEDAIKLINKNKFTARETSDVFCGQKSFLKNNSFAQSLRGELKDRLYDTAHTFGGVYNQDTNYAGGMYTSMKSMGTGEENLEENFNSSKNNAKARIALHPQETKFEEIAEDYYSYYLANRDFSFGEKLKDFERKTKVSPDVYKPSPRMEPELEARKHLKDLLPYMEKQYLASEVSSILVRELKRNDPEAWQEAARSLFDSESEDGAAVREVYGDDFEEYFKALKKGTHKQDDKILKAYYKNNNIFSTAPEGLFISEQILKEQILENFPFDIGKKIEEARYKKLDIVYNADKGTVEKDLIVELNKKIKKEKGKDYELGLNREKNIYEVVDTMAEMREITEEDIEMIKPLMESLQNEIDRLYEEKYILKGDKFLKFVEPGGDLVSQKSLEDIWDLAVESYPRPEEIKLYFGIKGKYLDDGDFFEMFDRSGAPKEALAFLLKDDIGDILNSKGKEWVKLKYNEFKEKGYFVDKTDEEYIEGRIENFDTKKQEGKESSSKETTRVEEIPLEYRAFSNVTNIDGKAAYQATKDGKNIIVWDGKEYGDEYQNTRSPSDIGGTLAYGAEKEGKQIIVWNDKEFGNEYYAVYFPTEINGTLAYQATKDGKNIIVWDGKEYGTEYSDASSLVEINGTLAYKATKDGKDIIVWNDKEFGNEYYAVYFPTEINGTLAYQATKDGKNIIVWDGKEYGTEYSDASSPVEINGTLAYKARKDGKNIIVWDGKEYGTEYDAVYFPTEINGTLAYQAMKEGKQIIVWDDKEYGTEYDAVYSYAEINGTLVYEVIKDWKTFIVYVEKEEKKSEFDKELNLLNLVHNPDKEKIKELLKDELINEEAKESSDDFARKSLRNSKAFLQGLAKTIKESPRDFIHTIAAKKTSAERMLAKQVVEKLLPGIYDAKQPGLYEKASQAFRDFFGGNSSSSESLIPRPGDYLRPQENMGYQGGNPSEQLKNRETVIESREALRGYISSGLFGREKNGNWSKVSAPLDMSIDGPTRENTFMIQLDGYGGRINLQKPVPAEIIPGRVQGRNESGQMVEITYTTNSLGESMAEVPAGISELVYSFTEPLLDETPRNIDSASLEVFKNKLSREGGEDYLAEVPGLDEEIDIFVDSIEGLTPKEKIFAVEKYVREIGYYDFENGEVSGMKRGATTDEMFYVMKTRLESLRDEKGLPEGKRFAGVCDDFSKLTTAILRKAGLPAGVMTCFRPNTGSKQVTVGDAHAASFVVWPSAEGKNKIYIVDGTPGGSTPEEQQMLEEMGIVQPTLEEKEQDSVEKKKELIQKAEQELQEVSEYLETLTPERIGEIDNGKLEKALNTILRYDVSYDNLNAITRILSAYRFSPLGKFDLSDLGDKIEAHKFIETELRLSREGREESQTKKEHHPGTKLFNTVKEFSAKEGLQKLQELNSVTKGILRDKEDRALRVIVKYLEAKRMV